MERAPKMGVRFASALVHEELEHGHGIARRERMGAVVVFLDERGEKGMERGFFRAGGTVRDGAAERFHHGYKMVQLFVGFDAFGHRLGKQLAVLDGTER